MLVPTLEVHAYRSISTSPGNVVAIACDHDRRNRGKGDLLRDCQGDEGGGCQQRSKTKHIEMCRCVFEFKKSVILIEQVVFKGMTGFSV